MVCSLSLPHMSPPILPQWLDAIGCPNRPYMLRDIREWRFIERGVDLGHRRAEVYDPLVRRPLHQVLTDNSGPQDIGVRPPVRVGGKPQPFPSEVPRYIKRAILVDTEECRRLARRQSSRPRKVDGVVRKVSVNMGGYLAVHGDGEARILRAKAHQRYPHRSAVNYPRLIRPSVEYVAVGNDPIEDVPVVAAPNGVRGNQTGAVELALCHQSARLVKPVADQIGG